MNKSKFTKETWLAAGFRALTKDGPTAIRAEALARNIGASKGSFYWNFADLSSFKAAMLTLWRDGVTEEINRHILAEPDPLKRLETLAARAAIPAPDAFGGRRVEPAMRSWAMTDPAALEAVNAVDKIRLELVAQLLREHGRNDAALAQIVYGAFIGLDDLASKGSADIQTALDALLRLVTVTVPVAKGGPQLT